MGKKERCTKESALKNYRVTAESGLDPRVEIHFKKSRFEATKNPVYALEAFLIADNNSILPLSPWVTDWVANAFRKYHASLGEEDLERLLGFKKGRGQNKAFKDVMVRDERNEMLLGDMARVRAYFGVTVEDAAYMVFRREDETPDSEWNKTRIKIKKISDRRLQDLYNSNPWCEEFKQQIEKSGPTFEKKKNYLKKFPEDSLPLDLKTRMK